jgi:hypothetical protein
MAWPTVAKDACSLTGPTARTRSLDIMQRCPRSFDAMLLPNPGEFKGKLVEEAKWASQNFCPRKPILNFA